MTDIITAGRPLILLGCGNMGGALLEGWLKGAVRPDSLHVVDPAGAERAAQAGLPADHIHETLPEGLKAGLLVVAVKPQMFEKALPGMAPAVDEKTVLLSIAAGQTIARLRSYFPNSGGIMRIMPNMPAAIGQGISVGYAEPAVAEAAVRFGGTLMEAAGEVRWVNDEDMIDAVTAVSGSGPAYVFYMIECLAAAAQAQGLPEDLAMDLARETVAGAGALAKQTGADPRILRRQVTSPGGTTEAGLEVLMGDAGLGILIRHTVAAAARRSRELRD